MAKLKSSASFRLNKRAIKLLLTASFLYLVALSIKQCLLIRKRPSHVWHNTDLPHTQRRRSHIECRWNTKTCLISNLYVINNEFHAYLGSNTNITDWQYMSVLTGIGWGTGVIRFQVVQSPIIKRNTAGKERIVAFTNKSNADNDDDFDNTSVSVDNARVIPLYIHASDPPNTNSLPSRFEYVVEPTVFFSVLWSNLFRTMYAGVAVWYSLLEYKILFTDHYRMVLLDTSPKPTKFIPLLQSVSPYQVSWFDEIPDGLYKAAILGLSRDALVAEIDLERGNQWRFGLRRQAYTTFCSTLKSKVLLKEIASTPSTFSSLYKAVDGHVLRYWKRPKVTLVLRDGEIRRILNEEEVIRALQSLPINLSVRRFGNLTLNEQVSITHNTDIFITMHGAALTHVLFLKPGAHVIELFPYAFRKYIFQNIAHIMDVNYLMWQNTRESDTVKHWKYIEENRLTAMPRERVEMLPIDWYNMDSKNYWRNQDTRVNVRELENIVRMAIESTTGRKSTRYLIYTPWEQLNNQIIGFKSACATARYLDRTLVIPALGYKNSTISGRQMFSPIDYVWAPLEHFFDMESLLSLPCKVITQENFHATLNGKKIETLRYHHLGDGITSESQVRDYFKHIVKMPFTRVVWDKAYYQLSKSEILKLHRKDDSKVLALGSMFWYYDFGIKQQFPLRKFYNYLDNSLYRDITKSLVVHERIERLASSAISNSSLSGTDFIAIHVRRGDYSQKCIEANTTGATTSNQLPHVSCWQSIYDIRKALRKIMASGMKSSVLYISTNSDDTSEFDILRGDWKSVILQKDILPPATPLFHPLDSILFDQVICTKAATFVGNLHSSFSRNIIEGRILQDKLSTVF
jgi:hypothetical protein